MSVENQARVTLISPSFFGYETAIREGLLKRGYNLVHFDDRPKNSNLFKILVRLRAFFLINWIINRHKKFLSEQISAHKSDYVFLINPELFTAQMIYELKKDNPKLKFILYLWDSVRNRKNFPSLIEACDVAFSFDRHDTQQFKKLKFHPLFFEEVFASSQAKDRFYDLAFVGSYHSNRAELFKFKRPEIRFFLHLFIQGYFVKLVRSIPLIVDFKTFKDFWILTSFGKLTKKETSDIFKQSNVVIDIQHPNQSGLTCRTFEALASGCKLVTSNKDVINYDFFDSNVIYVMNDLGDIPIRFILDKPHSDIMANLRQKIEYYSLDNWIQRVFVQSL